MSNLVEHLRDSGMHPLCEEAADEIERLERELAAARSTAEPVARGAAEKARHEANEWADAATSALVWLYNIADGISKPEEAIKNVERMIAHLRAAKVEARSTAEPVAWVIPGDDNARHDGALSAMAWQEGEFSCPLYAGAPPTTPTGEPVARKGHSVVLNYHLSKIGEALEFAREQHEQAVHCAGEIADDAPTGEPE